MLLDRVVSAILLLGVSVSSRNLFVAEATTRPVDGEVAAHSESNFLLPVIGIRENFDQSGASIELIKRGMMKSMAKAGTKGCADNLLLSSFYDRLIVVIFVKTLARARKL